MALKGAIFVELRDLFGAEVRGATIRITDQQAGGLFKECASYYVARDVPHGPHVLRIEAPAFVGRTIAIVLSSSEQWVQVGLQLVLIGDPTPKAATIRGELADVRKARTWIKFVSLFSDVVTSTKTDKNGRFCLHDVPHGDYLVFVIRNGAASLASQIRVTEHTAPLVVKTRSPPL